MSNEQAASNEEPKISENMSKIVGKWFDYINLKFQAIQTNPAIRDIGTLNGHCQDLMKEIISKHDGVEKSPENAILTKEEKFQFHQVITYLAQTVGFYPIEVLNKYNADQKKCTC